MMNKIAEYFFGTNQNIGNSILSFGWSLPEDGFIWADGKYAAIKIPYTVLQNNTFYFEFQCRICLQKNLHINSQLIHLFINRQDIGQVELVNHDVFAFKCTLLKSELREYLIELEMPNAIPASRLTGDHRSLSIGIERLSIYETYDQSFELHSVISSSYAKNNSGLLEYAQRHLGWDLKEIAESVVSLGSNCTFGFIQRHVGCESLGLYRFNQSSIRNLIKGLITNFSSLGELSNIMPFEEDGNWMIWENEYSMRYHTFQNTKSLTLKDMITREQKRLLFLARRFCEDLDDGNKVLLYKENFSISKERIYPLYISVKNRTKMPLLIMNIATDQYPPGSIREIEQNLFFGYTSDLMEPTQSHSYIEWLFCILEVNLIQRHRMG